MFQLVGKEYSNSIMKCNNSHSDNKASHLTSITAPPFQQMLATLTVKVNMDDITKNSVNKLAMVFVV